MKIRHLMGLCHPVATSSYRHRHTCVPPVALHTTTRCNTLQHAATRCNTLQHAATSCNTQQHTVLHTYMPPLVSHTATHCNTLQHTTQDTCMLPVASHTAAHGNTLQHAATQTATQLYAPNGVTHYKTATCCNTLQHTLQHTCMPPVASFILCESDLKSAPASQITFGSSSLCVHE